MVVRMLQIIKNYCRNSLRRLFTTKVAHEAEEVGLNLTVNGFSRVSSSTVLGDNVNFNGLFIRGGGPVEIGDNFHSGPECRILTRNHNYDSGDALPYDDTYMTKKVTIGDNVWFGVGVTVLPGVTISEGAIIQAESTVVNDVPIGGIVGGHPAKLIKHRDMEHYNKLKEEKRFH